MPSSSYRVEIERCLSSAREDQTVVSIPCSARVGKHPTSERDFTAYDTRRTRSPDSTGSNWATSVESSIADVLARPRLTAFRTASK